MHSRKKQVITKHFDEIAGEYDNYKRKNSYYYENLKTLFKDLMPDSNESNVLEVGCGTGDIVAMLNPHFGVGADISSKMISIAKSKYKMNKNLSFIEADADAISSDENFDYIILPDVLEHLCDCALTLKNLKRLMRPKTRLIVSWVNHRWTRILDIAERLKLKMPEGEHNWIPKKRFLEIGSGLSLCVIDHGYKLLCPIRVPVLSKLMNSYVIKLPFIRHLGLIQYCVLMNEEKK